MMHLRHLRGIIGRSRHDSANAAWKTACKRSVVPPMKASVAMRSNQRGFAQADKSVSDFGMMIDTPSNMPSGFHHKEPPRGDFRFIAVDVETAGYDIASICQIGLAFVGFDSSIATYSTYIDPCTPFAHGNTRLHGIDAETVIGAPTFAKLLPELRSILETHPLVQHSRFDEKSFDGACRLADLPVLRSVWTDSVAVARKAWPELRGNGGHGLGNLKKVLGLRFRHHDAGEDARAAAEVVLMAEASLGEKIRMLNASQQLVFDF
jgi:DNA polymerase-3 subunit epsilon